MIEHPPTTPEKKASFDLTDLHFWKNHLSLIVLIPYVIGGIWQIVELSGISIAYIRFFSVSQSIADGLMILIVLLLVFGSRMVWKRMAVTERAVRRWLMTDEETNVKTIVYLLTFTLSILIVSPLLFTLYRVFDGAFILYLLIGIVLWLAIYLSKDRFKNQSGQSLLQKTRITAFNWLRLALILVFIGYLFASIPFILDILHRSFVFPKNNLNLETQEELVKRRTHSESVDILYFNDQYIFWETTDSSDNSSIVVSGFEAMVGDSIQGVVEYVEIE